MANINRRQLLKTAVLGTAGTLSASAFSVLAQPAPGEGVQLAGGSISPHFTEGLVQVIDESTITALDTENLIQRVLVTDGTRIWKGLDTTLSDAEPGDFFYARGKRDNDGSFVAETLWFNIVSLPVEITDIQEGRVQFVGARSGPGVGHIMPYTVTAHGAQPASRDFSQLAVGRYVQVIGTIRPGTDEINISRIMM